MLTVDEIRTQSMIDSDRDQQRDETKCFCILSRWPDKWPTMIDIIAARLRGIETQNTDRCRCPDAEQADTAGSIMAGEKVPS